MSLFTKTPEQEAALGVLQNTYGADAVRIIGWEPSTTRILVEYTAHSGSRIRVSIGPDGKGKLR